jgi:hypothetical protein
LAAGFLVSDFRATDFLGLLAAAAVLSALRALFLAVRLAAGAAFLRAWPRPDACFGLSVFSATIFLAPLGIQRPSCPSIP